jgi:hypothetical protein
MNELCTFERTYLPVRTKLGAGSGLPEAHAIDAQSGGACHERARLVTISVNELRRVKVIEFRVSAD